MRFELYYVSPIPDWREAAIQQLEPDIRLFANRYKIRNLEYDDVAQEMRLHLWRKLEKYDPLKSGLRTWAQRVMRNRCTDLNRRANDTLDNDRRVFPEETVDGIESSHIFSLVDLSTKDQVFVDLFFKD